MIVLRSMQSEQISVKKVGRMFACLRKIPTFAPEFFAQVAELVDAHVSGACVERHAGSSPVLGTNLSDYYWMKKFSLRK